MSNHVEVVEITPTSDGAAVAVTHDRTDRIFRVVCSLHGYRYGHGYNRDATVDDISLACATAVDYGAKHAADCTQDLVPPADATRGA